MEKRFVLFIVLTMLVLTGHVFIQSKFAPKRPDVAEQAANLLGEKAPGGELDGAPQNSVSPAAESSDPDTGNGPSPKVAPPTGATDQVLNAAVADDLPKQQWLSVGSYDGTAGPLLVTFNSRGGGIERVELVQRLPNGRLKYRDLENPRGYLGHLVLSMNPGGGCRVNVVGLGTPAANAVSDNSSDPSGLQVGDVITAAAVGAGSEVQIQTPEDIDQILSKTKPGNSLSLTVTRGEATEKATQRFAVDLGVRPFQAIQPEPRQVGDELETPNTPSLLMSLASLDGAAIVQQLTGQSSPREGIWQASLLEEDRPEVEFRFPLTNLESGGRSANLELIKRFRLGSSSVEEVVRDHHFEIEIEIVNRGSEERRVQYSLDGPNGLPLEGWWYAYKTHPKMFYAAGARDILFGKGDAPSELIGCSAIYKRASQHPENPDTALLNEDSSIRFLAVDTQYFVSALTPLDESNKFSRANAVVVGGLKSKRLQKTTNVSFQLESTTFAIPPNSSIAERFELFVGPKQPELLAKYGLEETIYYGWFGAVARPLSSILHFFYRIVGNYGIAIIMLTILVRGCMFPLSRKAAKNAAMMQELAPEMKAITEKYKNDMEKRAKAQQELFRRNNYNPLGGCWVMFLQLPIFIGLYRSLSVDLELRQAALIPGWDWCSNLAGPDQLFYWGDFAFMGLFEKTGMLGPYFNILPLGTVALFLVQQKMFTPPATDEQTRMQLQVMKFMTLFIGIMFFKVASGLCLYFIASSMWGIAERKLLPKKNINTDPAPPPVEKRIEKPRVANRSIPSGASQKNGGKSKRKAKKRG